MILQMKNFVFLMLYGSAYA